MPGLGPVRFRRLEAHFGEMANAWNAGLAGLRAAGMEDRPAREIIAARDRVDPIAEMDRLDKAGVKALNWNHPQYPHRLKEIHDAPPLLYMKGDIQPGDERGLAVVGTRGPTAYGREVASSLTAGLAQSGICIISGLARGIDGTAHRAAIEAGGRTIAVVAPMVWTWFTLKSTHSSPSRCRNTARWFPSTLWGSGRTPKSFPRRNRLISGMSLGTLVIEAAEGSGARWTVYHALEQDREVFCVPGSIFSPASQFTNRMMKEGAKLVSSCGDVLEELNLGQWNQAVPVRQGELTLYPDPGDAGDPEEMSLLGHLGEEPLHIDELGRNAGLPITSVSCLLTMLELKGMVKQVGCMHYVRTREVSPVYGD